MHSGPASEVAEPVEYARETALLEGVRPRLTAVSPCPPDGLPPEGVRLDRYPA